MKNIKFRTAYNTSPDRGEVLSDELVTEPGQSFTTREIYERFLRTGRVEGMGRPVVYDEDELKREPNFSDYDDTQRGDFDLSDASSHQVNLVSNSQIRNAINNLSAAYATGKISFDEFCSQANEISPTYAKPFIDKFGSALAKKPSSQGKSDSD